MELWITADDLRGNIMPPFHATQGTVIGFGFPLGWKKDECVCYNIESISICQHQFY
jgi:hypothetical protein